ncbi:hypothetical protein ACWE42_11110 [Sutcliffiella cohnii]
MKILNGAPYYLVIEGIDYKIDESEFLETLVNNINECKVKKLGIYY